MRRRRAAAARGAPARPGTVAAIVAPGADLPHCHRADHVDRPLDQTSRGSGSGRSPSRSWRCSDSWSASSRLFATASASSASTFRSRGRSPITNFVWWIGIGHAGTLISAILLLLNQGWRNSINRFAEAMTLFAVACAGLFPLLHLGRPWVFYWLLPYPEHDDRPAAVSQPAGVGRLRGLHLRDRVAAVLVSRA